jgi:hypothetical protein
MPKEKKPSDSTAPKKTAAKKAPAKSAAKKAGAAKADAASVSSSFAVGHHGKPSAAELYDEIRRRAYELYVERGGKHGSHEDDWHRAEVEVRAKYK